MPYTREELQEQIDTLLSDKAETQCTRLMLNGLLSNILNSVTLQEDSANTVAVAGINVTDPANGVQVSGVKVLGEQCDIIDHLTDGETDVLETGVDTVVSTIKARINAILTAIESHGLIGKL